MKIKIRNKRPIAIGFVIGVAVVLLGVIFFGASNPHPQPTIQNLDSLFNATHITITHQNVTQTYGAYVASTTPQQQLGYMNQTSLGGCKGISPCIGMIFTFNKQQQLCFWMANTRIPLLQAWINQTGTVVGIYQAQPYSKQAVCYNATSVLETSLNQAIGVGDRVTVLKK